MTPALLLGALVAVTQTLVSDHQGCSGCSAHKRIGEIAALIGDDEDAVLRDCHVPVTRPWTGFPVGAGPDRQVGS